jgi:plastocyanin
MGANIRIQAASQKKGPARPGFFATTNDRGEYRAFNLPPGKYEFYCPVGNHKEMGMEGEITVN